MSKRDDVKAYRAAQARQDKLAAAEKRRGQRNETAAYLHQNAITDAAAAKVPWYRRL